MKFTHVRWQGNKVANLLAGWSTKNHQDVKYKCLMDVMDTMVHAKCVDIMAQDMQGNQDHEPSD